MLASLDRLAALEAGGARIFYGHDPEFWQSATAKKYRRLSQL
jgi:hypothetical protein